MVLFFSSNNKIKQLQLYINNTCIILIAITFEQAKLTTLKSISCREVTNF